MLLSLALRDLVLASWSVERERAAEALPPGLEPAPVDGRHLVTLVAFRVGGGRLGRLPVLPFAQVNVRTYVRFEGEPAVFFLAARVTGLGMAGALLGAPYRPARIRVEPGRVRAPGLGVSLAYRADGPADAGELGRHELGLFEAAGLRGFRVRRGPSEWLAAEPAGEPRADLLLAHGFDPQAPPSLFASARASFETELPPALLAGPGGRTGVRRRRSG